MIATMTYTRRPLRVRILRPFAIWWLRAWIRDEEKHIEHLRDGGIYNEDQLAERASNLTPLRARLILWEQA